jgi:protein-disulfide isomerase
LFGLSSPPNGDRLDNPELRLIRKLTLGTCLLIAGLATAGATLRAAELLMFEDPGCVWCRRWHAEIGPSYPNTDEGRRAPLRRIHIRDQEMAGVTLAARVTGTPTFVLADDGVEIGRIAGYPGPDFFYPMLGEILDRLPPLQPHRPPADRFTFQASGRCALT